MVDNYRGSIVDRRQPRWQGRDQATWFWPVVQHAKTSRDGRYMAQITGAPQDRSQMKDHIVVFYVPVESTARRKYPIQSWCQRLKPPHWRAPPVVNKSRSYIYFEEKHLENEERTPFGNTTDVLNWRLAWTIVSTSDGTVWLENKCEFSRVLNERGPIPGQRKRPCWVATIHQDFAQCQQKGKRGKGNV